jgi:L-ascorbate metabolism protein UlaG (beta-lactamase superfamily)
MKRRVSIFVLALCWLQAVAAEPLTIERLTWAGVKLVSGDTTVLIDAMATDLWDGDAPEGFVAASSDTRRTYALVTHMHNDHLDVEGLKKVLGEKGYVICHAPQAAYLASRGLRVMPAELHVPVFRGGFIFTAVPAEDGLGEEQVSWVVSIGERKFLHAGDTLWHGQWEMIGRQYGPFDIAFLPINGAKVAREPMPETPAVLTPLQALDAALLLRAEVLVPIHFGLNAPPNYVEIEAPLETLLHAADERQQVVRHMMPGEQDVLD